MGRSRDRLRTIYQRFKQQNPCKKYREPLEKSKKKERAGKQPHVVEDQGEIVQPGTH